MTAVPVVVRFVPATVMFAAALFACRMAVAADGLRGPWDTPVIAHAWMPRRTPPCPLAPALSTGIDASDYYSDPAHSVIDPARLRAYDDATRDLDETARTVGAMADAYRRSGDASLAACVAAWLDTSARAGTLTGRMSTNQAVYEQGWMLGAFAIAWLKVRASTHIPPEERPRIAAWLATVADLNRHYYDSRAAKNIDARNNHRYWAGLAVMAAGIAADWPDLFEWGIASFRVGASQVAPDGRLPLEMARRARALHYHLFAASALVEIAELASANGIDLYHARNDALIRLVHRCVAGIEDPTFFAENAGIAQEPIKLKAADIGWATPFVRRFPDTRLEAMLAEAGVHPILNLGGLPP
jgi:poly(beta-D-mannuronate) lyase